MAQYWQYNSLRQAEEVLDHYENFLLRCPYVVYIAIVENETSDLPCYELEIGLTYEAWDKDPNKSKVKIDEHLSAIDVLFGNFCTCTIPSNLPVPSEFIYEKADCKCSEYTQKNISGGLSQMFSVSVNQQFRYFDYDEGPIQKQIKSDSIGTLEHWLDNYQYGGMPVSNGHNMGTLGGVFKLKDYGDTLFGITNWHIFPGSDDHIGCEVYTDEDKSIEIGNLFWKCVDTLREVAFVLFNNPTSEAFKKKLNLEDNWRIASPKNHMPVKHYGYGSNSDKGKVQESTIYSTNATVRVTLGNKMRKIFRHQLLIDDNTIDGDSGSLVITDSGKNDAVVGLNFSKINEIKKLKKGKKPITYTVANNINYIFNHKFYEKQLVLNIQEYDDDAQTKFANKFTLNNYKLSK